MGAGTYVLAVSGGVDSMVLLDLLRKRPGIHLVVAHYDHGIRSDSIKDRKLVQEVARTYKLPFVHSEGNLGPGTSEAKARTARYKFLHNVRAASGAKAIITAHHQDDVIETAIMNIMRGTGRRGLSSLKSNETLVRPLLNYDKETIREYAQTHALAWREDPSNSDTTYTRNYIRAKIVPKFSAGERAQLTILLDKIASINHELDVHLTGLLHIQPALDILDRMWFIHLPHDIAREVLHTWLSRHEVRNISKKTIERLVVAMKTGKPGQKIDIDSGHILLIKRYVLALGYIER